MPRGTGHSAHNCRYILERRVTWGSVTNVSNFAGTLAAASAIPVLNLLFSRSGAAPARLTRRARDARLRSFGEAAADHHHHAALVHQRSFLAMLRHPLQSARQGR